MRRTTLAPLLLALLPAACKGVEYAPVRVGSLLLVLNKSDDSLSIVDPRSGVELDRIATDEGPHEVAVAPSGEVAVVTNYGRQVPGNTLTVVDLVERRAGRTIDLGEHRRPHGVVFLDHERRVLVTTEESRSLLEVAVRSGEIVRVLDTKQDVSHMVALAPDRSRAFVSNIGSGSLSTFDLETGALAAVTPTGQGAEGLDVSPDGREVWVANRDEDTISVVDARTLDLLDHFPCGRFPIRLKFTPDGERVLVSNANSGDVAVIEAATRTELARIPMALDETEASAVETDGRVFAGREGPVPVGILIDPTGAFAFVANTKADLVTVIDLESLAILGRIPTDREPDGLGWFFVRRSPFWPDEGSHLRLGVGAGVRIGG